MKFPDHSDLTTVTIEDVGEFRVTMDRIGAVDPRDATIATLRAALDGLVEAGRSYIDAVDADLYREGTPEDWWEREATLAALRAALATAKETP